MTRLRVVTWNAEGMFVEGSKTRRALPHEALLVLRQLNADIVVVPEFGDIGTLHEETALAIHSLGYQLLLAAYDDDRSPGVGIAVMSRLPVVSKHQHTLPETGRPFLEVHCRNESGQILRVLGVHLDDRSEAIRMKQIVDVADIVNAHLALPTLLLGDFNAMHEDSRFARMARSSAARLLSRHVRHEQLSSIAARVHEMAYGTTINYIIENTTLHDFDTKHRRTISAKQAGLEWAPTLKLAKIDWIFGSKQFKPIHYRVLRDVGSDHRPVIAELEY